VLDRLLSDTVRLQLQLENSLYFAAQDSLKLFLEPVSLKQIIDRVVLQWPGLKIRVQPECLVRADERALQSVLSNLIQNAIVHGQATEVSFLAKRRGAKYVEIQFADNGKGFQGPVRELGQLFHRATSQSGSGLGIYICRALLQKMNGQIEIESKSSGFGGHLILEGNVQ
jgi:signal transduction histidine kinase